ncbi:3-phosphoshikimate 1-carboxyvinyltransferase [Pedobacter duraquae]|uniref:3-phosphoshikimate 1-carboxyvinyltransferase n=1 Tax=Pedobacter duraquae TaxID=425511 RepID=A0A4R6IQJ1_9SPHI|nr:3-phosphoshikimate 1-carboxyvinyltransferase [Pedobacter duraquae]TDO24634.1 3-phosphoshikimate 1-carboxyvinyltransferase [Pedobacter duraquae]
MKKNAFVSFSGKSPVNATIYLTGSKSESNRALVIAALSNGLVEVKNLSDAADTVTLNGILQKLDKNTTSVQTVDVGHAGTAMRFLTAFLSTTPGRFLLTGSKRMKERPIKLLVEALTTLGASINYTEEEGYPPLEINGGFTQKTASISIKGDVSSQYLSALLIIAPVLELGLTLTIEGYLTSRPYVEMTLKMLEETGITHSWNDNIIQINKQDHKSSTLVVEPDWSAASYWYSIVALLDDATIALPHLKHASLQGDSRIQSIMTILGVSTSRTAEGISLKKVLPSSDIDDILDLQDCPDLAQTIIVCAAAKGLHLKFTGLETLKIKETNRVKALQNELAKIGVELVEDNLIYTLVCDNLHFPEKVVFKTYDDHRMAMAFAPLSILIKEIEMEDMDVVEKSYPDFWSDLEKAGFIIKS